MHGAMHSGLWALGIQAGAYCNIQEERYESGIVSGKREH